MIHWSSGREGHNNYRRDLVIWLVHLIYTVRLAKVALCYNYVILNYCIRFAVLPCVRLCLNSCYHYYHHHASPSPSPRSLLLLSPLLLTTSPSLPLLVISFSLSLVQCCSGIFVSVVPLVPSRLPYIQYVATNIYYFGDKWTTRGKNVTNCGPFRPH